MIRYGYDNYLVKLVQEPDRWVATIDESHPWYELNNKPGEPGMTPTGYGATPGEAVEDLVGTKRPRLSPAQLELVKRVAGRRMGWVDLHGDEFNVAAALERRGLGQRVGFRTFELTDKGREAARLLGLCTGGQGGGFVQTTGDGLLSPDIIVTGGNLVRQSGEASDGDPYAEGVEAAASGQSDTANPYPVPGDDHLSWNDGYNSIAGADEP